VRNDLTLFIDGNQQVESTQIPNRSRFLSI
jgi:hypothetical protein